MFILGELKSVGTHLIALYVNGNNATYFDSFGVEHIPKETKKFLESKNIITNIYKKQAHDSMMCGYFCIGFIEFMLKNKSCPNEYEKNDKLILKYFP